MVIKKWSMGSQRFLLGMVTNQHGIPLMIKFFQEMNLMKSLLDILTNLKDHLKID